MTDRTARDEAEAHASIWLVRLESDDVTVEDHRRFATWLNEAADHQVAFEAVSRTWSRLGALKSSAPHGRQPERPRRRAVLVGAGAALAAAAAMILVLTSAVGGRVYATAIGERVIVTLADGSTAELNAATRMHVIYSVDARRVVLDAGEALFTVRADAARPFAVETRYGVVRVGATSVIVRLTPGETRATVLRGVISCEESRRSPLPGLLQRDVDAPAGTAQTAAANDEIRLRASGLERQTLPPRTIQSRLAWRDGMLAFDGETLSEAASEVERQTGLHFSFADPALAALRIGGYIKATDKEAFLRLLANDLQIRAIRIDANHVRLTSARERDDAADQAPL